MSGRIKKAMPWRLNRKSHQSPCLSLPDRQAGGRQAVTSHQLSFLIYILTGIGVFFSGNSCLALENRTFDAQVDFLARSSKAHLELKDKGSLDIAAKFDDEKYEAHIVLRHIKFGQSDLSTDFYTSGTILRTSGKGLKLVKGKAWTQASLLNFKPLKEFAADYEIKDSRLVINSLSWADIQCRGFIEGSNAELENILFDQKFDLSLNIKDMDLKDFAGLLGISPEDLELSGGVSGNIAVTGPKEAVKIQAELAALEGNIAKVKFSSAKINLEGLWPILRFTSGQINDVEGGVYELKGQFSLTELSNFNSSGHKVIISSANNTVRFQDWIIKRELDKSGQDTVEAKYPLKNNESLKMRIRNQEETLGWEKSVKF